MNDSPRGSDDGTPDQVESQRGEASEPRPAGAASSPARLRSDVVARIGEAASGLLAVAAAAAEAEAETITIAAERLAAVISGGGTVYAVGAGHAQAFAMELCSRAGGLRKFIAMNLEDVRDGKRDSWNQLRDSAPERDPAIASPLLDHHGVTMADAVLIASNSGRNGGMIELALECRRRGIYTVAFTSRQHSMSAPSRHASGQRLLDVADEVVDIHTPYGDATVEIPGVGRACSASTVSFAVLAQMLNLAVIETLLANGQTPQVLISANVG